VAAFRLGFSRWRRAGIAVAGARPFGEGNDGASATVRERRCRRGRPRGEARQSAWLHGEEGSREGERESDWRRDSTSESVPGLRATPTDVLFLLSRLFLAF
jgi:hypothetical protein